MVTYVPEALDDEDPAIVTEVMRATRAVGRSRRGLMMLFLLAR